jgi:hypothetical protein
MGGDPRPAAPHRSAATPATHRRASCPPGRLREVRRLGHAELSRELADVGRDIAPLGLRRIETGERRVDVDDLLALAVALEAPLTVLLMPDVADGAATVTATGVGKQRAWGLWNWLVGVTRPREGQSFAAFLAGPWPTFIQREMDKRAQEIAEDERRGCSGRPVQRTRSSNRYGHS